ncbi:MAG: O-antigen ligase family protein [Terriglobia bacterium]
MKPESFALADPLLSGAPPPGLLAIESAAVSFSGARFVLLAALLAVPLAFGAVQPWAWSCLILASLLALLFWAIGCLRVGSIKIIWSPLYLPLGMFLLLATYQYFGHRTLAPTETRECLLKLTADALVFFLVLQLAETTPNGQWRGFGLAVCVYAFGMALFAVLQFFSSHDQIYWSVKLPPGNAVFGPYENHNHYAGLMEMLIPISAGFVFSLRKTPGIKRFLAIAVVVSVAAFLLSGSRGGMISLTIEAIILATVIGRQGSGRRGSAAIMGTLAAALLAFLWMDPGAVSERLETVFRPSHWSTGEDFKFRRVVPLDSLGILHDYTWLGAGLGSFETVYPRYRSFPSDLDWDHAHDDYAEALAETGLIGGILIVTAVALFLAGAFRNARRSEGAAEWIQLGAAIGCCGLLVHSFMDFNFHLPANAMWFATCAALAQSRRERTPRVAHRST